MHYAHLILCNKCVPNNVVTVATLTYVLPRARTTEYCPSHRDWHQDSPGFTKIHPQPHLPARQEHLKASEGVLMPPVTCLALKRTPESRLWLRLRDGSWQRVPLPQAHNPGSCGPPDPMPGIPLGDVIISPIMFTNKAIKTLYIFEMVCTPKMLVCVILMPLTNMYAY